MAFLDGREFVAVFLAELLGQRLDRVLDRFRAGIQQAHFLDVEFVRDQVGVRFTAGRSLTLATEKAASASGWRTLRLAF